MIFDKEEWPMIRDTEGRFADGQVDNRVVVIPLRGPKTEVAIVPPTQMYDFLLNGMKAVRRREGVLACLTLAETEPKRWKLYLSFYKRSLATRCLLPVDVCLWAYTSRPKWA